MGAGVGAGACRPQARCDAGSVKGGRGFISPGAAHPCSARTNLGMEDVKAETIRSNPAGSTPARQRLTTSRKRALHASAVTHYLKRRQQISKPRDGVSKSHLLASSVSRAWGQYRVAVKVRQRRAGRDLRAGQRYGTDCPGTWEILCSTNSIGPAHGAKEMGQGPGGRLHRQGSERRRRELGRGSESISDPVFGAGSLSALVVLTTSGNAARADPIEESEAPLLQNRFCETRRGH